MPSLDQHQSNEYTKMLIMGDSGCLSADTIVSVTRGRSKGKYRTIEQLFNMRQHYRHDEALETYLLSNVGGYVSLNRMEQVVYSGYKPVRIVRAGDKIIRATEDHLFNTDDGWLPLAKLKPIHWLNSWRESRGEFLGRLPAERVWIYSLPYHPSATDQWVEGKNYKRDQRARLIVEAEMNKLTLSEFIRVLRQDPTRAATLQYLPRNVDVHHENHNPMDDRLENLLVLDRSDHIALHQMDKVRASKSIDMVKIDEISDGRMDHTYDIVMSDPHRNFIANGLEVHNSGKTGSLASLVAAGYKLRILDYDNGLEPLKQFVLKTCPEKIGNVEFRTLRDKRRATAAGPVIDGTPKAFVDGVKMLDHWKYDDVDLGVPGDWGPDTILVLDSLTFMSDAAFDFREPLTPRSRDGKYDVRAVYKDAQDAVENVLALLTSESFQTNVIVISHVKYVDNPDGSKKGYPTAVGSALSPLIGRYFNSVALCQTSAGGKRTIQTVATAMIDLKNPKPFAMAPSYPIDNGLAQFFAVLREQPKPVQEQPQPTSQPQPSFVQPPTQLKFRKV